jgi:hypothetical protein
MEPWERIGRDILAEWKAKREIEEPYATAEEEAHWALREKLRKMLDDAVREALVNGDGIPLAICIKRSELFDREQIAGRPMASNAGQ